MTTIEIPEINLRLDIPNFEKYLKDHCITNKPHLPTITDIYKLRKIFNVPFIFEPVLKGEVGWDGVLLRVGNLYIDDVIHEICHYIIAPPSRRKHKDFGLGGGFNSKGWVKRIVSEHFALEEEELVCVLQWILMYNLGYAKYITYTMYDQNWNNSKEDKLQIKKHLKTLIKKYEINNSRNQIV